MIGNQLLRLLFFVIAWLFPVACCIAWTPTSTTKLVDTSQNAHGNRRSNLWGVVAARGGFFDNNGVEKKSIHRVLILMDVFCDFHGRYLTEMAREVYGVRCIYVLSDYMANYMTFKQQHRRQQDQDDDFDDREGIEKEMPPFPRMPTSPEETIEWQRDLVEDLLDHLKSINKNYNDIEIKGLICESDPGLDDAERLSTWLNVTNHNGYNEARRNKFMTNSAVASRKIPTVGQKLCDTVEAAIEFATDQFSSLSAKVVVVKPVRGCASDDVFLCDNLESVRSAYEAIKGTTVLGSPTKKHESILVQEYAVGQEYAIDTVSKNGKLKIAAVWKYDKRPQPPTREGVTVDVDESTTIDETSQSKNGNIETNGRRRQVYYATRLYDDGDDSINNEESDPLLPVIYQYLDDCLNALDIRWGVTHSELIITTDGPRLVEVNCRQHNMDFVPLTDNAIGYNLYDMLLAAYFGDDDDQGIEDDLLTDARVNWDLLPDYPSTRLNAAMVHLVNDKRGVLKRLNENALYEIQSMESVIDLEVFPEFLEPGISRIEPTVDIKTDAGWIQMLHPDNEIFQRDYQRIMELMPTLFEV
jgi:hypothetical protein